MKLIVGLGNKGNEYNFTRHNFGFLALDFYFKVNNLSFNPHEKFDALFEKQGNTIFLKPKLYYNESGIPVEKFASFYKVPKKDILIICDDFNIPFGTLRKREKGSAGGNNGLKSIISSLNSEDFPRLRLGTGNDALRKKIGDVDFVLSRFTEAEKSDLPEILENIRKEIDDFIKK